MNSNHNNNEGSLTAKIIAAVIWALLAVCGIFLIALPYAKDLTFGKLFFPFLGGLIAAFSLYCIYKTFEPGKQSDRKFAALEFTFENELSGAFEAPEKAELRKRLISAAEQIGSSPEADMAAVDALTDLLSVCESPKEHRAVLFFTALAYEGTDDDEALALYAKALEYDANTASALFNSANILSERKRYGDAAEYYKKAIEIEPDNQFYYYHAARDLICAGDYENAREYAQTATDIQHDFYPAYVLLSVIYAALGNSDASAANAKTAISRGADRDAVEALISAALDKSAIPFDEYQF